VLIEKESLFITRVCICRPSRSKGKCKGKGKGKVIPLQSRCGPEVG